MASILEDLTLVETILGDVAGFAAGTPVAISRTIGPDTFNISVQALPGGPVAPFQSIEGNLFAILGAVLTDYEAIVSGAPVALAAKVKESWYGVTVTMQMKTAPQTYEAPK